MRRLFWPQVVLSGFAFACSNPTFNTEIAVVIHSDMAIPAEMDNIRVDVKGPSETHSYSFQLTASGQAGKTTLPVQISLVPPDNKNTAFDVTAYGLLGNVVIVSQEASSTFLPGQRRVLTLVLGRACAGITCGPGYTCASGGCNQSIAVLPSSLPTYDPNHLPSPPDAGTKSWLDGGTADGGIGAETGNSTLAVDAAADGRGSVEVTDGPREIVLDAEMDVPIGGNNPPLDGGAYRDAASVDVLGGAETGLIDGAGESPVDAPIGAGGSGGSGSGGVMGSGGGGGSGGIGGAGGMGGAGGSIGGAGGGGGAGGMGGTGSGTGGAGAQLGVFDQSYFDQSNWQ